MSSKHNVVFLIVLVVLLSACQKTAKTELDQILQSVKKVEVFNDDFTQDWTKQWVLDGQRATVNNTDEGMDFFAGKEQGNDTCHAVLWTKKSFQGDLLLQYEYTRLDTQNRNVNIIYIQATGEKPLDKNIHQWHKKRAVPSMFKYFHNMNTLHISYAAYPVAGSDSDYVRARRYMPLTKTLGKTNFGQSFENTGLFKTNIPYQITIAKIGFDLFMQVQANDGEATLYRWNYSDFPIVKEGYIGLRHMYTRGARYKNFKIYQLSSK
ncbi:DUF1961 family protein [Labilibacter marinus]|uniref:DUF1961 family protein n=1 Tax=Labilibacter marinus TaxID=1477105 RepID=UPI00082F0C04|nr:DUF1961 family protein [Labilibacter marinus]